MTSHPPVCPYTAGLGCNCPRYGQGPLFEGYLPLSRGCDICALDYRQSDSGDGPAVFAIFITGFVGIAFAFIARFSWEAPIWIAFLLSTGMALGLTGLLLRPLKATLIALHYRHKGGGNGTP